MSEPTYQVRPAVGSGYAVWFGDKYPSNGCRLVGCCNSERAARRMIRKHRSKRPDYFWEETASGFPILQDLRAEALAGRI